MSDYLSKRMRIKFIDEVQFCCKEMKEYYESHDDIKLDGDRGRIIVEGKSLGECPFCNTDIEIDVSVAHWGGEK